uniref:Golgi associated, gamma adaptin ear containing, ARF binding protein 3b n=1 Tax=Pygocentrus nattereri TaxID=42514 RepID=A0AAR2KCD1_PYGNA
MAYQEGESLESWLNKATHPTNRQEDWEYIIGFCDQINKELEGPQIAVRLLVHKIHSPQEWEALQALTVLEACMKNCGRRFHNEVAKYRFLNELIKVVSPKYMGDTVSQNVKTKIIEMLYSWTVAFPNEAKISDAYQTLRRQGLVSSDPELTADKTLIPSPPTRPKNPVFDNEDMGKVSFWVYDDARVQKLTKRLNTLEEVNNNVKLLGEMLSHYDRDRSSDADRELIKELYDRCDKLRRTAFKLATETEDNDTNLGDILQANDDLARVISLYKKVVQGESDGTENEEHKPAPREGEHKHTHTHTHTCTIHTVLFFSQNSLSMLFLGLSRLCFSFSLSHCLNLQTLFNCGITGSITEVTVFIEIYEIEIDILSSGKALPVTAYDKDGVRVLLHFATDCPPGRPDVLVIVVSMLNTAPLPVQNIMLQAAVPKSMKVKLQSPTGTELAPFNPVLPPSSITQVMLLANPLKEKVRLRYKLMFLLGERQYCEVGEVDQFPPAERWGNL